jgi:hypothetical protein
MATIIELTNAVIGLINFDPRKILEIEPPSPFPAPHFPLHAHLLAFPGCNARFVETISQRRMEEC